MKCVFSLWLGVCGVLLAASGSLAQVVGEGATTVAPTLNVPPAGTDIFYINGGEVAGTNLFHSFTQFGLAANQVASYQITDPAIQNVFSRVMGGNASVINGAIATAGGSIPNFYFMNPAGVVFGPNFTLNIPGAFTATTANGIGFGANWFSATGTNNFATLLGNPTAFGFTMAQPAAIINNSTALAESYSTQPLALIAGTVVSPSAVSRAGTLTIAGVPGKSLVRITSTDSLLGLEIRPFQVGETQPNHVVAAIPSLAQLITGPNPNGGTVGDATGVSVNPDGTLTLTGAGMRIQPGDVQTAALKGTGVLIGAPVGNVTVSTIAANDLGVDITAGKLFQATSTLAPLDYRTLFLELLPQPNSELLAFLKLKTGLSDAAIISKYPGFGGTVPQVAFPSVASIYVSRAGIPGNANVIIRHGGSSVVNALGYGGINASGDAPFSLGGKVTLDSPDLANRYSFINPAANFADLAASSPISGSAIPSESANFTLRRNQSATTVPIPANSSGTVGAIVQLVRLDGGFTATYGNQVFGTLPTTPVNPTVATSPSTSTTTASANPTNVVVVPDGGVLAATQRSRTRDNDNAKCGPKSPKASTGSVAQAGCASTGNDAAILKILE
jgi:filamentous hemagglutinin family protein